MDNDTPITGTLTAIEWQAVEDALEFTGRTAGLVSDAHCRAVPKVETIKAVAARPAELFSLVDISHAVPLIHGGPGGCNGVDTDETYKQIAALLARVRDGIKANALGVCYEFIADINTTATERAAVQEIADRIKQRAW